MSWSCPLEYCSILHQSKSSPSYKSLWYSGPTKNQKSTLEYSSSIPPYDPYDPYGFLRCYKLTKFTKPRKSSKLPPDPGPEARHGRRRFVAGRGHFAGVGKCRAGAADGGGHEHLGGSETVKKKTPGRIAPSWWLGCHV